MIDPQQQQQHLFTILVGAIVILALYYFFSWRKRKQSRLPPGGRGRWPFVGDTLRLLNPRTMTVYQIECKRIFGNIWRTSVLFNNTVFVASADLLKELSRVERTNKNSTSACFPPHHKALFGQHSVLVTSGHEHLRLRSLIGPTLAPSKYVSEISAAAEEFVDRCASKDGCFSLVPELKRYSLRVMLRVLFGNDLWSYLESSQQLDMLIQDINCWSEGLLAPPTSFLPWTIAGKAKKARFRLRDKILELIHISKNQQEKSASLLKGLVDRKLQSDDEQSVLSNDAIIDNILTLLFAGSDTTASILTSAFFVLANEPGLLNRLQGSVDNIKELEAFLTETQRLYPAAPFTMRVVTAEEGIYLGGYHIPKGWFVTYSLAATLLDDESTYPNAARFDIERWLSPSNTPPIWSFGGGHRMCPGRFLANAESIALLQEILKNQWSWSLESNQNLTYQYHPGFFPVDGLRIRLRHEA